VHVARVPKRGRGRAVQRPGANARPLRPVVRRAVSRLRVHQKAVRPLSAARIGGAENAPLIGDGLSITGPTLGHAELQEL